MSSIEFPDVLGEMPGRYRPSWLPLQQGCPDQVVTARFVHLDAMYLWISLVHDGAEVWRCNPSFFAAWFTREADVAEAA